jgi:hypothetical protein
MKSHTHTYTYAQITYRNISHTCTHTHIAHYHIQIHITHTERDTHTHPHMLDNRNATFTVVLTVPGGIQHRILPCAVPERVVLHKVQWARIITI